MTDTKMVDHKVSHYDGHTKPSLEVVNSIPEGTVINASGHVQEVDRNFSLLSLSAVGIVTGCVWPALGGGILVAIYNGGPPGVIFEFVTSAFCYLFVFLSIAELASACPSSAGVYHWASICAGPKWGKSIGFLAGWWNFLAWIMGAAAQSGVLGNIVVSMYGIFHPDYVYSRWHVYIVYLFMCWFSCLLVMFFNRALPGIQKLGLVLIVAGCITTVLVCAIMPSTTGSGYATSEAVWTAWQNNTGYKSDGFTFLLGMLNGAFALSTPDVTSHLSEEIPNPRRNVPIAMAAQLSIGFVTAFIYIVAVFYSINDFDAISSTLLATPLAAIYEQATNSRAGAIGLLMVILLPVLCTLIGCFITAGRILWTLARDDVVPFSNYAGKISPSGKNPLNATLICGIISTVLGAIYVGSYTAFNAFIGSFAILSTLSYIAAILPNMITRGRYLAPGPFRMRGIIGHIVRIFACTYIVVFVVIFCFPYSMPVTADLMNYAVVIVGGFTILVLGWYFWKRGRGYEGPACMRQDWSGKGGIVGHETATGEIIVERM